MSVSQAVDYYHLGTFDLGDFLLTDFKDENVEPERFTAPVSDVDIEKLISSQTNEQTLTPKRIQSGLLVLDALHRYGMQPVGTNILDLFMKEICQKGGIQGNYSNHSGKRTCATQLYQAGIEEQEIMGITGYRSNAVRNYKTSNETIQKKVSNVLNQPRDSAETAAAPIFEENASDEATSEN
ncbi:unnamed protein product [Mytilus coruscus]|uniref:Tyr recombinase domain-containing protein n=1 Tax=Mytilus coruscus TaxID=42192 RepID=A0A6J7ZWY8_MYTCO|nr:unnamed protein product [Mytilus coruscus]